MHLCLEKAILPILMKVTSIELPEIVKGVIVIQGLTADAKTGIEFIPPSYIPSSTRHLKLLVRSYYLLFYTVCLLIVLKL